MKRSFSSFFLPLRQCCHLFVNLLFYHTFYFSQKLRIMQVPMYVKLIISENGLLFCKPNSHLMKISCFGDTVSQPFLKPFSKRYTPLGYVSICFIPFYVYFLWLHCYYYYHCIHIQIQELLPLKMMTKKGKGFICSLDSSEVRMLVKVEN